MADQLGAVKVVLSSVVGVAGQARGAGVIDAAGRNVRVPAFTLAVAVISDVTHVLVQAAVMAESVSVVQNLNQSAVR